MTLRKISIYCIVMGWTLPSTGMWRGEIFAISDCLVISCIYNIGRANISMHWKRHVKDFANISGMPSSIYIYVTFVVYTIRALMVMSVRHSVLLWGVSLCALSWRRMNIKRETLAATSGPRVFRERSWWWILDMIGAKSIVWGKRI